MLGWLEKSDCQLGKTTLGTLRRLRRADPRWRPEWDEGADRSWNGGGGGTVRTNSDPAPIVNAPLHKIIPLAKRHTLHPLSELTNYKPFDGLVKQWPRRAVAALTYEARQGNYPIGFWYSTLQEWPEETKDRLVWLFCERLTRLPSNSVAALKGVLFRWLGSRFPKLAGQDRTRALRIFDTLLDKLFENYPAATKSQIREIDIVGQRQHRSRPMLDDAISGPVGEATELLLNLLNAAKPKTASYIPADLKSRLERLITAPGEGSDHAICIIAKELRWLDYVDPNWTRATILPWFDPEGPAAEPAWSGFLADNQLPAPALFSLLKPHYLNVFNHASQWHRGDHALLRLHEFLVIGCFRHLNDSAYISYDEARSALQRTDHNGRTHSINCLNRCLLNGDRTNWKRFGRPFLRKAWPREDRLRTAETSRGFAELAERAGDFFPEAVEAILSFLVPLSRGGLFVYGLARQGDDGEEALATRFPEAALALIDKLVPNNPDQLPYKLDIVVEMIAEANPSLGQDGRWRRLNDIVLKR